METLHQPQRVFRLLHPGVRFVVGFVAAAAALAAATLVFGPLADQQTLALAGVALHEPRNAAAAPQVQVAEFRPATQMK